MFSITSTLSLIRGSVRILRTVCRLVEDKGTVVDDTVSQLELDISRPKETPDANSTSHHGSPRLLEYQAKARKIGKQKKV